jgi:hypothetical protein
MRSYRLTPGVLSRGDRHIRAYSCGYRGSTPTGEDGTASPPPLPCRRSRIRYSGVQILVRLPVPMPVNSAAMTLRFVRSDAGAEWSRDRGTLLERGNPSASPRVWASGPASVAQHDANLGAVDNSRSPSPVGEGSVLILPPGAAR